jgi:hypothetical protein
MYYLQDSKPAEVFSKFSTEEFSSSVVESADFVEPSS